MNYSVKINQHQTMNNVHDENSCIGPYCTIHNPSDFAESIGKQFWRSDRGIMERICSHGIGHPDPDNLFFIEKTMGKKDADNFSVHGCDGCCLAAEEKTE